MCSPAVIELRTPFVIKVTVEICRTLVKTKLEFTEKRDDVFRICNTKDAPEYTILHINPNSSYQKEPVYFIQ